MYPGYSQSRRRKCDEIAEFQGYIYWYTGASAVLMTADSEYAWERPASYWRYVTDRSEKTHQKMHLPHETGRADASGAIGRELDSAQLKSFQYSTISWNMEQNPYISHSHTKTASVSPQAVFPNLHTAGQPTVTPDEAGPSAPSARSSTAPHLVPGSRPHRSRKNRPCDYCRRSKSRCAIGPAGPPCTLCNDSGRKCTFDHAPPPRPARVVPPTDTGSSIHDDLVDSPHMFGSSSGGSPVRKRPREDGDIGSNSRIGAGPTHGLDLLTSAVPSFDHLANSKYDPHGDYPLI